MTTKRSFPEGLIGRKVGMTQFFNDEGLAIPVTVLELGPCTILDVKSSDNGGYDAVQFGFGVKKMQRVNKPMQGHFNKAKQGAFYLVREIRCDAQALGWTEVGSQVAAADVFAPGDFVDVTGTSIGRGFSGVFRRWGMKGQPSTRGTHEVRRHGGAIGNRKSPGRVFKNKKMPGHLGNSRTTLQNLKVVSVRPEEGVVLVSGNVPGPKNGFIEVRKSIKKASQREQQAA